MPILSTLVLTPTLTSSHHSVTPLPPVTPNICSLAPYAQLTPLYGFPPALTFCKHQCETPRPAAPACPNGNVLCNMLASLEGAEKKMVSTACSCIEHAPTMMINVPKTSSLKASTTKASSKSLSSTSTTHSSSKITPQTTVPSSKSSSQSIQAGNRTSQSTATSRSSTSVTSKTSSKVTFSPSTTNHVSTSSSETMSPTKLTPTTSSKSTLLTQTTKLSSPSKETTSSSSPPLSKSSSSKPSTKNTVSTQATKPSSTSKASTTSPSLSPSTTGNSVSQAGSTKSDSAITFSALATSEANTAPTSLSQSGSSIRQSSIGSPIPTQATIPLAPSEGSLDVSSSTIPPKSNAIESPAPTIIQSLSPTAPLTVTPTLPASVTTPASPACTSLSPNPGTNTCGNIIGLYIGASVLKTGSAATVEECALSCKSAPGCASFGFFTGQPRCDLYQDSVSQLQIQISAIAGVRDPLLQQFYDLECFDCTSTGPADTVSVSLIESTSSVASTLAPSEPTITPSEPAVTFPESTVFPTEPTTISAGFSVTAIDPSPILLPPTIITPNTIPPMEPTPVTPKPVEASVSISLSINLPDPSILPSNPLTPMEPTSPAASEPTCTPILTPTCPTISSPPYTYSQYYSGTHHLESPLNDGNTRPLAHPPLTSTYPPTLSMCEAVQACADAAAGDANDETYSSFDLHFLCEEGGDGRNGGQAKWECVRYFDSNSDAGAFNVRDERVVVGYGFSRLDQGVEGEGEE